MSAKPSTVGVVCATQRGLLPAYSALESEAGLSDPEDEGGEERRKRDAAVERLGPQTTSLFGNLIPVSTFTIETIRGYRPSPIELVGSLITIGALVASNLLTRPRPVADQPEAEPEDELLEAA
jgi:hypothetical protein